MTGFDPLGTESLHTGVAKTFILGLLNPAQPSYGSQYLKWFAHMTCAPKLSYSMQKCGQNIAVFRTVYKTNVVKLLSVMWFRYSVSQYQARMKKTKVATVKQ